jgi:hypothetical protein
MIIIIIIIIITTLSVSRALSVIGYLAVDDKIGTKQTVWPIP